MQIRNHLSKPCCEQEGKKSEGEEREEIQSESQQKEPVRPGRKRGFAGHRPTGERHNEPLPPNAVRLMEEWFGAHSADPYPAEEDRLHFVNDGLPFISTEFSRFFIHLHPHTYSIQKVSSSHLRQI